MIEIKDIENLLSKPKRIEEIRSLILSEEIIILKRFIDPHWIDKVKIIFQLLVKFITQLS